MYRSNRDINTPPPLAYPGHLTRLRARGGGNLTSVVVVGVGNLTPDGRGAGNLINLPRFHVTRYVVSFIEIMPECERELTLEDFKGQNCAFVTEWLSGEAQRASKAVRCVCMYNIYCILKIAYEYLYRKTIQLDTQWKVKSVGNSS